MDTVIRLERGEYIKLATIERLRLTFTAAGIEFDDGDAPGVKLRRQFTASGQQPDLDMSDVILSVTGSGRLDGGLPVRLQRLRASFGQKIGVRLSQEKFALMLGIATARYSSYERGDREPGLAILAALRTLTGVSLNELIVGCCADVESQSPHTIAVRP